MPLIVNVMGFSRDEVAELVRAFAEREEVAALELNVSCPNVETGLIMGADPREVASLLERMRPLTDKPLIVKLTPNAGDVPAVARAAEQSGATAVSLINTIRGMALDPRSGQPWLGGRTGGVSGTGRALGGAGPGVCGGQAVDLPMIAMGGIERGMDALDFLRAGATLVAVGTESFRDPAAGGRIAAELSGLLGKQRGLTDLENPQASRDRFVNHPKKSLQTQAIPETRLDMPSPQVELYPNYRFLL